jgi:hypothetical protein
MRSYDVSEVVICRRVPRVRAGYTRGGRQVGRARVFFFKTVPYPSHTRARRGYGYGGTRAHGAGTRVLDYSGTGTVITVSEPL